jgi:hypothetical protein
MPAAQSPAHYINSSKGCPSITESFPLYCFLVPCATVAALSVVQPHRQSTHSRPIRLKDATGLHAAVQKTGLSVQCGEADIGCAWGQCINICSRESIVNSSH